MSIFRKPKGTYTRATSDWFQRFACIAHGFHSHVGAGKETFELYNNDPLGNNLVIQHITWTVEVPDAVEIYPIQGQYGTLFPNPGGCFPINISLPAVSGQFSYNAFSPQPPAQYFGTTTGFVTYDLGASFDNPLFIIPPTWGLLVGQDGSSHELDVTIWYQVIPN